jgi:hypothetical protein
MVGLCTLAFAGVARATVTQFIATINGAQETPPNGSAGTGTGSFVLDTGVAHSLTFNITFSGLGSAELFAHIHGPAPKGTPAVVIFGLPAGSPKVGVWSPLTPTQEQMILDNLTYVNIHSTVFPGGEIRGQIVSIAHPTSVPSAPHTALIAFGLALLATGGLILRRRAGLRA